MLFNAGPNTKIASVRYTIHQIANKRLTHRASRDYLYRMRTGKTCGGMNQKTETTKTLFLTADQACRAIV